MDFSKINNYIFDSDGVLLEEGKIIAGASELTRHLQAMGKKIYIFSNNSTKHPETMRIHYEELGISVDGVINSGMLVVDYLNKQKIDNVYVVGEDGFISLLRQNGIEHHEGDVQAVIVGMDRNLTYEKLRIASRKIINGARYIASNPDNSFPTPRGLEPGAGSMIAAISAASAIEPEIILGKPNTYGYNFIVDKYGLKRSETLMIGDRFETDILGAIQSSIHALVINTGVAKTRENPGKYGEYTASVIENLSELLAKTS